jgi:hypothetical protein
MAKEQKRGNKEAKKPKKVKEAAVSVVSSFSSKMAYPQIGTKKK